MRSNSHLWTPPLVVGRMIFSKLTRTSRLHTKKNAFASACREALRASNEADRRSGPDGKKTKNGLPGGGLQSRWRYFFVFSRAPHPYWRPLVALLAFWPSEGPANGNTRRKKRHTVDGRNPFRTTLKPWETIVCWNLQGNHHSRASWVVQDFVHPQYHGGPFKEVQEPVFFLGFPAPRSRWPRPLQAQKRSSR